MRSPARIEPTLKLIEMLWRRYPDQRLGQLLYNLTRHEQYYVEDEELQMKICNVLADGWPVDKSSTPTQAGDA
jgi:hypothetical protein